MKSYQILFKYFIGGELQSKWQRVDYRHYRNYNGAKRIYENGKYKYCTGEVYKTELK